MKSHTNFNLKLFERTLVVAEDFFNIVRFEKFGCQEYTSN